MEIYGTILGVKISKNQEGKEYIRATLATNWTDFDNKYAICKGSKVLNFSLNGDLVRKFKEEALSKASPAISLVCVYGKTVVDGNLRTDYNKIEVVDFNLKK